MKFDIKCCFSCKFLLGIVYFMNDYLKQCTNFIFCWRILSFFYETYSLRFTKHCRGTYSYMFYFYISSLNKKRSKKKRSRKTNEPACKKENTWKVDDISEFLREWMCWCVIVTTQEHVLYTPTGSKKPSCQIQFHSCWKLRLTSLTSPVTEWYSGLQYRQSSAKNI